MSQSVNRAIIIGHLGRDPDLAARREGEGKIASFGVATSETWTDRASGERREKTQWHRVVSFNDHLSAVIERRCQKGTLVYVEGHLETRKWTDQQGQDRYVTEIIIDRFDGNLKVLANGRSTGDGRFDEDRPSRSTAQRPAPATTSNAQDVDDEIPF
ncbi:single-stranded DNA-binding protein [Komagataeibacter melaceti]|uniref:Single-stranded DNA-binding protein n=1 Tax=Komagataeibacter melaceti TaxID=2766577 RepID=A0A371YY06_9PROT|nr:single-stranded DNA-binding protein [Komagataeibacter melaceti]RFD19093.1 single-stranded DNA-binding protein [Komagataeibacter melaceti]